jgi:hypothetical protein
MSNMLLMPALKICNPVEAFIQMIIHDPARCTCWHLRNHMWPIPILRSLPSQMQNPLPVRDIRIRTGVLTAHDTVMSRIVQLSDRSSRTLSR